VRSPTTVSDAYLNITYVIHLRFAQPFKKISTHTLCATYLSVRKFYAGLNAYAEPPFSAAKQPLFSGLKFNPLSPLSLTRHYCGCHSVTYSHSLCHTLSLLLSPTYPLPRSAGKQAGRCTHRRKKEFTKTRGHRNRNIRVY
jgi:hypothetical protein